MRSIDEYALPGTEEERRAAWPLVQKNGGLVVWVTHRYVNRLMLRRGKTTPYFMRLSRQDLFDELYPAALEGALKAAINYNEDRGMFSTYATLLIEQALMATVERMMKTYDLGARSVGPDWLYEHANRIVFPPPHEEIRDETIAAALRTLAEPEQSALSLRAEGKSFKEIGEVLEISTSQAYRLVNKASKKMIKELGGDDGLPG